MEENDDKKERERTATCGKDKEKVKVFGFFTSSLSFIVSLLCSCYGADTKQTKFRQSEIS